MFSQIVKFSLSTTQFTAIIAPFACSYYGILGNEDSNGNRINIPMTRSSAPGTASAQYNMMQNESYGVVVPARFGAYRYAQGQAVTNLQAIGEACTAIVEFFE
jgi:hypothetical protein